MDYPVHVDERKKKRRRSRGGIYTCAALTSRLPEGPLSLATTRCAYKLSPVTPSVLFSSIVNGRYFESHPLLEEHPWISLLPRAIRSEDGRSCLEWDAKSLLLAHSYLSAANAVRRASRTEQGTARASIFSDRTRRRPMLLTLYKRAVQEIRKGQLSKGQCFAKLHAPRIRTP